MTPTTTTGPAPARLASAERTDALAPLAPADLAPAEIAEAVARPEKARSTPSFLRRVDSPIGRIEIVSDGEAIVSLAIEREGSLPHDGRPDTMSGVLDTAADQLTEYFSGVRQEFDVPVSLAGTAFQRAVWEQLRQLRFGEVTTYGSIGAATGRPTAGRAVGGAIGANPVPIIVGCHRVLSSDTRITGYSGGNGIPTKVWLLDHEGISHR